MIRRLIAKLRRRQDPPKMLVIVRGKGAWRYWTDERGRVCREEVHGEDIINAYPE